MATRHERIALNEAMFRVGNERINAWPETQEAPSGKQLLYLCECADSDCRKHIPMTPQDYEAIRADAMHFVIVSGHERPGAERVIQRSDRYVVVEKKEDVRPLVERTNPRSS